MTLKKFIKYFDTMTKLNIREFPPGNDAEGKILFEGHTFDEGAEETLKKLYKAGYVLDRNEDGDAVMIINHINKHNVPVSIAFINVKKGI